MNNGMLPGANYLEKLEQLGKTNRTVMKIKNIIKHALNSGLVSTYELLNAV